MSAGRLWPWLLVPAGGAVALQWREWGLPWWCGTGGIGIALVALLVLGWRAQKLGLRLLIWGVVMVGAVILAFWALRIWDPIPLLQSVEK